MATRGFAIGRCDQCVHVQTNDEARSMDCSVTRCGQCWLAQPASSKVTDIGGAKERLGAAAVTGAMGISQGGLVGAFKAVGRGLYSVSSEVEVLLLKASADPQEQKREELCNHDLTCP
ncbi:hypothetical protein AAFF_G00322740 [Aldrovandia affinis]|uniref:Uncharacterized protein n=1 Tax=Aldrovandia affinis TaxID=143900 RepID=A0AAD7WQH9_9TELE|nr:hypothetical protein AAFF_G00322740 [Aldrovandia affinis]